MRGSDLSFDPVVALTGDTSQSTLTGTLLPLRRIGRWAWNLGGWGTNTKGFAQCLRMKNAFIDYCVAHQDGAWFKSTTPHSRSIIRDIDWMDDGLRRDLFEAFWESQVVARCSSEGREENALGFALLRINRYHPSKLYWTHAIECISGARDADEADDVDALLQYAIEAAEALRQGIACGSPENDEVHMSLEDLMREARSENARRAAVTRHAKPGGTREKKQAIRKIWASGKYSSRDVCAEQECAALGMAFATARKALRGTPDPT